MTQSTPAKFLVWRERQRKIADYVEMFTLQDEVNPLERTARFLRIMGDTAAAQADQLKRRGAVTSTHRSTKFGY